MENIVKSVGEFLQLIDAICENNHNAEFYFRGASRQYEKTEASLFRQGNKCLKNYRKMKKEFERHLSSEFAQLEDNAFLAFCLHYGLPTNLIEISNNALVALYYACADDMDMDGYVSLFARSLFSDVTSFITRDTDALICRADFEIMFNDDEGSLFDFDFTPKIDWNLDVLRSIYDSSDGYSPSAQCDTIEEFISTILPEPNAQTKTEIELEFFAQIPPLLYNPVMSFRSGLSRNSLFILQDYLFQPECGIMQKQRVNVDHEIRIDKDTKRTIIRQLDGLGVNQSTIEGDLGSIAKYIIQKYR